MGRALVTVTKKALGRKRSGPSSGGRSLSEVARVLALILGLILMFAAGVGQVVIRFHPLSITLQR